MEQRLLIILGLLVTSNTGFVLALLPQLSGAKGILQVKEGGRKGSRGEKESSTIFLQSGVTLPPGSASPGPQGTPIPGYEQMSPSFHLEPDSGGAHRRERRCTCYTYKDKECVYYCHLDIIWINTPESFRNLSPGAKSSKASSYNVKYGMVPALLNNFGLYCFFYCSLWIIAISMRTQQQDKILEYGQSKTAEDV
ncbi:endothelin-3 isoform X2 [Ranitomeya imitator]|uniref:endothelin-3 isoform X2 n=1 Tax=Ranitomeya imitator TaxID=111125 RepID=UPI0037E767F5